ncbi:MAG TPA: guanylate kinase [Campylobacterales bacterium]|nr:guanylate kinase [Campylobacterales bacterium]
MSGSILVLSGPSGCGKSSLVTEILKEYDDIYFSISTTTRAIREGEKDGVNYHYIAKEQFEKEIAEGLFLEWAKVHDNYYGTSLKAVKQALAEGKLVIFDIDVQGHEIVKEQFDDILTSLFITTPSAEILRARLLNRGTDSVDVIEKRLTNSREEMDRIDEYDFLLVNDNFEEALAKFRFIVGASRMKIDTKSKDNFINTWYNGP